MVTTGCTCGCGLVFQMVLVLLVLLPALNGRAVKPDSDMIDLSKIPPRRYLTLKKAPHRIYLSRTEILATLHEKDKWENQVDNKFVYQLVEPTPCKQFKATFGCCWDNKTIATGPNGEGCPECRDQKRSCKKWTDFCSTDLIRVVCPQSCGACPKVKSNCDDEADQRAYCPLFKRFGLCARHQIYTVCRNTCGKC